MQKCLYESTYKLKKHFSFGKNWQDFSKCLTEERVKNAQKSIDEFVDVKGKSFVDMGCGSGLFSLAAFLLGASQILSVDVDDFSLECTQQLRHKYGDPPNWKIERSSALDNKLEQTLGTFDVVYSWGVLHHTGRMYAALDSVSKLVSSGGYFYLAIYNNNKNNRLEGTSKFWIKIKRFYNRSSKFIKKIIEVGYISYFFIGLLINFINPVKYIKEYKSLRGMNFFSDIKDWLGGYPYEFATVEEIVVFLKEKGFKSVKTKSVHGLGCNEFLFKKQYK